MSVWGPAIGEELTATVAPRFCYVILAHTDPPGLRRLTSRIRVLSPQCHIVVRHEDPALIGPAELDPLGAIDLVSSVPAQWGSWTIVQAMLEAFDVAVRRTDASYVVLISGQDYPIRRLVDWEREVVESGADALLQPMTLLPQTYGRCWWRFSLPGPRSVAKRGCHWLMDRVGRITDPRIQLYRLSRTGPDTWWFSVPRPGGRVPPPWLTKASQWMTLRRELVERIVRTAGMDGRGIRHLRTVQIPDEVAIQSLATQLGAHIVPAPTSALRFASAGDTSPAWLTVELVRDLAARERAPFVRKMPPEGWEEVVAAADAVTGRQMPQIA